MNIKRERFIFTVLIAATLFAGAAFGQQSLPAAGAYFTVPGTLLYDNKKIPGFVQEIPGEFKEIILLHRVNAVQLEPEISALIKKTEESLLITPQNDTLLLKRAILEYERKDYVKAEKMFESLVDRSAKPEVDENAFFYLGLIAAERQAYKESKYYFERIIAMNKKRANAYINLGISLFFLKEYDKATDAFESVLILRPNDPVVYFYRGLISYSKNNMDKAAVGFRWAKRLGSEDPMFARWTDSLMENDTRIIDLSIAIKRKPKLLDNYIQLGWLYISYGAVAESESVFSEAPRINATQYWRIYLGLSEVYLYKSDFKRAEGYALKAIEISPWNEGSIDALIGRIRIHAKDYKGAEDMLKQSILLRPAQEAFYSHALLGQVYILENKIKEAEQELEACRKTGARHPEIDELEMKIARYKRING